MAQRTPTKTIHNKVYDAINPTNPQLSAAGKTVLITGGGQGIGASIAQAFSLAQAASIVLLGRKLSTLNETKSAIEGLPTNGSKVHTFEADITNQAGIDKTFATIASDIGTLDIFLIGIQAFLRHRTPSSSTLIAINTAAAHMYYIAAIAAYVVSKAGAAKLYDQVAAEHADVRVFNLHPGLVKTAMSKKAGMDTLPADEPELPAAMTVYLASPEGDFLKGRFVWASWDVQELKEMRAEIEATEMWGQMGLVGWDGFKHTSKAPWE